MDWTVVQRLLLTRVLQNISPLRGVAGSIPDLESRGKLLILAVISSGLAIGISLTCVLSLLVDAVTGWLRPTTCFYWLTLLSPKTRLGNGSLFVIIFAIPVIELLAQLMCPAIGSKSFFVLSVLFLATAGTGVHVRLDDRLCESRLSAATARLRLPRARPDSRVRLALLVPILVVRRNVLLGHDQRPMHGVADPLPGRGGEAECGE